MKVLIDSYHDCNPFEGLVHMVHHCPMCEIVSNSRSVGDLELFPPLTLSLSISGIFFVPTYMVLLFKKTFLCLSTTCSRLISLFKGYIPTYISSSIVTGIWKGGNNVINYIIFYEFLVTKIEMHFWDTTFLCWNQSPSNRLSYISLYD